MYKKNALFIENGDKLQRNYNRYIKKDMKRPYVIINEEEKESIKNIINKENRNEYNKLNVADELGVNLQISLEFLYY